MIILDTQTLNRLNDFLDKVEKRQDKPWIKGKVNLSKWLGVSPKTVQKMMENGLPVHFVKDVDAYFFNKQEINEYLLEQ